MNFFHLAISILVIFELTEATENSTALSIKNCGDNGIMQVQNFSTGTDKYGNWYINGAFVVLKNVTVMTKIEIDVGFDGNKMVPYLSISGDMLPFGMDKSALKFTLEPNSYPFSFNSSSIKWIVSAVPSGVFSLLEIPVFNQSIEAKFSLKSTTKPSYLITCIDIYLDATGILDRFKEISEGHETNTSGIGSIFSGLLDGISDFFS